MENNSSRSIFNFKKQAGHNGRNFLLMVAIDSYLYHSPLQNAVHDARAVVNILTRRFEFDFEEGVKELYNAQATRSELFKALLEYQRTLRPNDSLMIWFGGHGTFNSKTESGFWVPVDAPRESEVDYIDVDWFVKQLTALEAGHIAVIADSCHSGGIFHSIASGGVRKKNNLPAPWVLTSGRCDEAVSDGIYNNHSPFARCLINFWEQCEQPAILFRDLEPVVLTERFSTRQQPCCRQIMGAGDVGGHFVFRLRKGAEENSTDPATKLVSIDERVRTASNRYYTQLRRGRFKLLNISDLILTETAPRFFESTVQVDLGEYGVHSAQLPQMLRRLWAPEVKHAMVMGDGGMGKTVALIRLWERWKDDSTAPVPLFISLNEYNALGSEGERTFLRDSIFRNYLELHQFSPNEEAEFWRWLEAEPSGQAPAAVLMLDGLNEVTREKGWLEKEIRNFLERCRSVQVVITTRYDLRNFTFLQYFEKMDLLPLTRQQITDYLVKEGRTPPSANIAEGLLTLLGNPMMLTLYAATDEWAIKCRGDHRFAFIQQVGTAGELLWNFTEAQYAKLLEQTPASAPDVYAERCDFLLRFLVPWIAYSMESRGFYVVAESKAHQLDFNFELLIQQGIESFNSPDFFRAFPRFHIRNKEEALFMMANGDWESELYRFEAVKTWLFEYFRIFVQEDNAVRFTHQNFRDFFAACHLRNFAEMAMMNNFLPTEWDNRPFPIYVVRNLAELENEYHRNPSFETKNGEQPNARPQGILYRLLDALRGQFAVDEPGFSVSNILKIIAHGKGNLIGLNLSSLDLRNIPFNEVQLSGHRGRIYFPAIFKNALLDGAQFFFYGHIKEINSLAYSPDGNKMLSASEDGTIKEWSLLTRTCLRTYLGHKSSVKSAIYSPDGQTILSSGADCTIKEWSVKTGECINTLAGSALDQDLPEEQPGKTQESNSGWLHFHMMQVNTAKYHPTERKILSCSHDGSIKQWSLEKSSCIWAVYEPFKEGSGMEKAPSEVFSAVYSPCGQKILTVSTYGGKVKEWTVATRENTKGFFHKHLVRTAVYSKDGSKILTATENKIYTWNAKNGDLIQILKGHEAKVNCAFFNQDDSKIVSASDDGTVRIWSVKDGICLQTYSNNGFVAKYAVFSPDDTRVLAGFKNGNIKEWILANGDCLHTYAGHFAGTNSVLYSRDGKKALSASDDYTVKEWALKHGICVQSFIGHDSKLMRAMYNVNEQKVVSTTWDRQLKVWSTETGDCLKTFAWDTDGLMSVVASLDGHKALCAYEDRTVREWSIQTGECLLILEGHQDWVMNAIYNNDGTKILSCSSDGTIREWSTATGECLCIYTGHTNGVQFAVYNEDNDQIYSISKDRTAKQWSVATGECIQTHPSDFGRVYVDIARGQMAPDGIRFLTGGANNTIIEERSTNGEVVQKLIDEVGLFIQGCDFRNLHPSAFFTEWEKDRMRRYGAIFDDGDDLRWRDTLNDIY